MARLKKFRGTGTALVTPFKKDGTIDETALRKLVDYQIAGGVEAIIPIGTTGESPSISSDEHRRILEIVIERSRGRIKVFAGSGSNYTKKAIELTHLAKDLGADAAILVAPYYNKPTQEGYFQHYRAVAEAVDIPLIVYNVPGRTGGNIAASTTLRMAEEIPSIMAVKEASGNIRTDHGNCAQQAETFFAPLRRRCDYAADIVGRRRWMHFGCGKSAPERFFGYGAGRIVGKLEKSAAAAQ